MDDGAGKLFLKVSFIVVAVFVFGILSFQYFMQPAPQKAAVTETDKEPFSDGEIKPLFYLSPVTNEDLVATCPGTKDIDWEIAIVALSDYFEYGAGATSTEDYGAAEIQRNFEQNCKRDMAIYTDVVIRNPHLFKRDKVSSSSAEATQNKTDSRGNIYIETSATDRNDFLFEANAEGEYQVVVNATNEGIQKYKDLIWDDIDFWNHRGFALYKLGECNEAGAAFYHVLVRDPKNEVASAFTASIVKDGCKKP